jgi:hypothetical protein
VFNPRNNVERYASQALRFIHPYLAFVTYRFHVEKSREIGKFEEMISICCRRPLIYILHAIARSSMLAMGRLLALEGVFLLYAKPGQCLFNLILYRY